MLCSFTLRRKLIWLSVTDRREKYWTDTNLFHLWESHVWKIYWQRSTRHGPVLFMICSSMAIILWVSGTTDSTARIASQLIISLNRNIITPCFRCWKDWNKGDIRTIRFFFVEEALPTISLWIQQHDHELEMWLK